MNQHSIQLLFNKENSLIGELLGEDRSVLTLCSAVGNLSPLKRKKTQARPAF